MPKMHHLVIEGVTLVNIKTQDTEDSDEWETVKEYEWEWYNICIKLLITREVILMDI